MNNSEGPKRHRPSQRKIELDLYFLPDRMPKSLRHPLEAAGGRDALIRLDRAEGHLSPSGDSTKGWQISLTVCPPGEGHFMGIDLSIAEAKRLMKVLDYVVAWQEELKARAEVPPTPSKKEVKSVKRKKATEAGKPNVKSAARKSRRS